MKLNIGVVDLGINNLFSINNAIKYLGHNSNISSDNKLLEKSECLILPGVGSFGYASHILKKKKLDEMIKKYSRSGKTLIGICLGFQLLFNQSEEFGFYRGLSIFDGEVKKLDNLKKNANIPNVGWRKTFIYNNNKIQYFDNFYYVHSFFAKPKEKKEILMESKFENKTFCSAIKKNNIYGCQFHPEKSGEAGINLLDKFIKNEI